MRNLSPVPRPGDLVVVLVGQPDVEITAETHHQLPAAVGRLTAVADG